MGLHAMRLLSAVFLLAISTADAQSRTLKGTRQLRSAQGDSFEDRMHMYSQWTKMASSHGRSLFELADSPVPAPPVVPPTPEGPPAVPPTPESPPAVPPTPEGPPAVPPTPEGPPAVPPTPEGPPAVPPTPEGPPAVPPTPENPPIVPPTPEHPPVTPSTPEHPPVTPSTPENPPVTPPTTGSPPPSGPYTSVVQPQSSGNSPPAGPYTSVVQPQSSNPSTPSTGSAVPTMPGSGGCKVLRYHTGFANTTLYYNRTIKDTPNFGECCHRCQEDPYCVAWTRVAGGDAPNFRNCYLKYDFKALDQSPDRLTGNHEGHDNDTEKYPELRYVDEGYANPEAPIILESGTIPDYYPAEYYGCPYKPGNPTTPCVAPPTCNFNGEGKFVAPPCIE